MNRAFQTIIIIIVMVEVMVTITNTMILARFGIPLKNVHCANIETFSLIFINVIVICIEMPSMWFFDLGCEHKVYTIKSMFGIMVASLIMSLRTIMLNMMSLYDAMQR